MPLAGPTDPRATPAMQQYRRFKERHPGCILLFRMGDFYEMFDQDAVDVSKAIGLTLTQRSAGVPMAGMPYHQLENYLKKLLAAGFRVAVCDQLQDADKAKGIVPRGITRVITPGTLVDESLLDADAVNTLAAVAFTGSGEASPAEVAMIEVASGRFVLASIPGAPASGVGTGPLVDELARRGVREVLFADATNDGVPPPRVKAALDALGLAGTPRPAWEFRADEAMRTLRQHFGVSTLAGFGLRDDDPAIGAAGALLRYLLQTQTLSEADLKAIPEGAAGVLAMRGTLRHVRPPERALADGAMVLDAVTLRALEIERTLRGATEGSLLSIFTGRGSSARTPMGKRLVREWLCRPLRQATDIRARQDAVAVLAAERALAEAIGGVLARVQDVPRLIGRVALARCSPRDLRALAQSLEAGRHAAEALRGCAALETIQRRLGDATAELGDLPGRLLASLSSEPPANIRDGGAIAPGVDAELDEARLLERDAGSWLTAYQAQLIERFSLPGLKVGFNKIFGYYIELPQAQARQAPAELIRAQTLKNAERYTTPELREFEGKVLSASARALDRERAIFQGLCELAAGATPAIQRLADALAELDATLCFADKAHARGWTRPEIVAEPILDIRGGRHPVLDETLGPSLVPNDLRLGAGDAGDDGQTPSNAGPTKTGPTKIGPSKAGPSLALITGPNMAGKSTYIRQGALLAVLAHAGSFLPADFARVGVIDRIFTRIGADDALHAGQSTFMVEMVETANILHHAGERSLVVLDEVGRGTSTLDGLSLAWAIVEMLARVGARALFATHYHELTDLAQRQPDRIANLHVAVREWPPGDDHAQIVFLHRILPGHADRSYGLHVARLAGIPRDVIDRAREVLGTLAVHHAGGGGTPHGDSIAAIPAPNEPAPPRRPGNDGQFALFTEYLDHPALTHLRSLRLDHMTPIQAFDALRTLHDLARDTAPDR